MGISVVVPAHNEEKRLGLTLKRITSYLKNREHEIIVVDDGSTDKTVEVASKLKARVLSNKPNRGKGYSVKRGILSSKQELVLFSDSDLATPIKELDKLMKFIKKYDVVIGSRNLKGSDIKVKQPLFRRLMGRVFNLVVSVVALKGFKDTQCGFKLFKTEAAKRIVALQTFDRFSFDIEILFIARKLGYKIKEVPVVWIDSAQSKVSPVKDGINMLVDIFRVRLNNIMGKYRVR